MLENSYEAFQKVASLRTVLASLRDATKLACLLAWESRKLPGLFKKPARVIRAGFFDFSGLAIPAALSDDD
jgi:hypothetical protein